MIRNIRHRGLKADQLKRIRRVLGILNSANTLETLEALPGLRLHQLKGNYRGFWAVSVSGSWRIVFRFQDGEAIDVDLVDYH